MAEKGGHWVKSAGGGMSFKPSDGGANSGLGHIEVTATSTKWVGGAGKLVPAKMRQEILAAAARGDPYYFWTDKKTGLESAYRLGRAARGQIENLTMTELRTWSAN